MRVGIVGGGIGGLAAAAFLRRAGLADVSVYERAGRLGEAGAGIQMAPNAARLLTRLDLGDMLQRDAVRLEVGWELRRWQDGAVLSGQPLGDACEARFGAPYLVLRRSHLLDALASAAGRLELGRECTDVVAAGEEVELRFADHPPVRADVVIGADGIHSAVRGAIVQPAPPRFSGLAAYRWVVDARDAPELARRPVFTSWLGPGRHVVHYPLSGGTEINLVAVVPAGAWRTESWISEGSVDELGAEFAGWDDRVTQLAQAAPRAWLYALYDREPLDGWSSGRIALLGDAAHPMLPFFAQGAGQAIEDAAVLAACLARAQDGDAPAALARYQATRLKRASRVQRLSRGRPDRNHLPDGAEQRRRDAELAGSDPVERDAWLYDHDAELALAATAT